MARTSKWVAENLDLLLSDKTDSEIQKLFPKLKATTIDRRRREAREAVREGTLKTEVSARPLKEFPTIEYRQPKILVIDIETSYLIAKVWGPLYETSVIDGYNGVLADWKILTYAWSWYGSGKTQVVGQCDFPDWKPGVNDDKSIMEHMYKTWNEADIVIAHNGKRFDFPKIRTRFFANGFPPPKNPEEFDTKQISSGQFAFTSNRQGDLGVQLTLDEMKADPGGIKTWDGCLVGDMKAWRRMKSYNKQDVIQLCLVYEKFMPWVKKHPNVAQITGSLDACPRCGAVSSMEHKDYKYTQTNTYKLFQCSNCNGWSRDRAAVKSKDKVVYVT